MLNQSGQTQRSATGTFHRRRQGARATPTAARAPARREFHFPLQDRDFRDPRHHADHPHGPPSPISQHAASGQNPPHDQRRPQHPFAPCFLPYASESHIHPQMTLKPHVTRAHPTTGRRRSAHTPQAGEIFDKIGGGRNAFGGFGHPGGELASPGHVLRGEDGAQIRDQRLLSSGGKASGGAHL